VASLRRTLGHGRALISSQNRNPRVRIESQVREFVNYKSRGLKLAISDFSRLPRVLTHFRLHCDITSNANFIMVNTNYRGATRKMTGQAARLMLAKQMLVTEIS